MRASLRPFLADRFSGHRIRMASSPHPISSGFPATSIREPSAWLRRACHPDAARDAGRTGRVPGKMQLSVENN